MRNLPTGSTAHVAARSNVNYYLHFSELPSIETGSPNLATTKTRSRSSRTAKAATSALRPALQQRSQDKRDRLIKAGIRAFAERGYEGTRITDIAAAAGLSVGVFYQRFSDKRGFFEALHVEFMQRGNANWDRFQDAADPRWSPFELIEHAVRNVARVIDRNNGFFRALITLGHKDKTVFPATTELDRHGATVIARLLEARGAINGTQADYERVYFGVASTIKYLVLMTLHGHAIASPDVTARAAAMLARYLDIDAR
jgi:AcrR family transcriptional regulator